eukprot:TRINITY_DN9887_c0_g1::TRINITY_DN9887_c0_g1_i1::g.2896::m.2896 TRINITY_DN9887_c0_g1::TRINITY_DN9887_c0_g1_i1::g.2896  ORF type:complete len:239 (-),score=-18.29,sp/Q84TH4/SR45A_ARATH/44.55/6e-16,RRM_1/PF00076.17/2.3e-13,RRM_6/PF14259.1/6.5e-12,RRM_5/PF13893.1/2.6e-07,DUF4661/PF15576.1/0.57 TRINITY_DN9887_c0_g1_i1:383-1099(-)
MSDRNDSSRSPSRRHARTPSPSGSYKHAKPERTRSRSRSPAKKDTRRSRTRSPSERDDRKRDGRDGRDEEDHLYLAGLGHQVTESEIKRKLERYGTVVSLRLVTDPRSGMSRGFGFARMSSSSEANLCVEKLHDSDIGGRRITVERAKQQKARDPTPGQYLGRRTPMPIMPRDPRDHRRDFRRDDRFPEYTRVDPYERDRFYDRGDRYQERDRYGGYDRFPERFDRYAPERDRDRRRY